MSRITSEHLPHLEEIRQLKARYCRLIDSRRWDLLTEAFVPDARFEGFTIVEEGVDAAGFVSGLSAALEGALTVHHCHTPEIRMTGDGAAKGIWSMTDLVEWSQPRKLAVSPSATGFRGYGFYEEQYRLDDGIWRISFMRLTRTRVDPILNGARDPSHDPFSSNTQFIAPSAQWLAQGGVK